MTILYITKIFLRRIFFICYSLCPYLEGIKDALCYKLRRLMIGQNCSTLCINKGGHRDAFSNERHEVLGGLLSMPLSLERSERRGVFFIIL